MQDQIDDVKQEVVDIKITLATLLPNLADMALSIRSLSEVTKDLAVNTQVIKDLSSDVHTIAKEHRNDRDVFESKIVAVHNRIDSLHGSTELRQTEHEKSCSTGLAEIHEKGQSRSWVYLGSGVGLVLAILAAVFSFLTTAISGMATNVDDIKEIVIENRTSITQHMKESDTKFKTIDDRLSKATGHRYYLNKELKGSK